MVAAVGAPYAESRVSKLKGGSAFGLSPEINTGCAAEALVQLGHFSRHIYLFR
jgi:hypothetical protein